MALAGLRLAPPEDGTGSANPSTVDHRQGRLLIVDDEAAIRFALAEYFRENGWTVDSAAEKEEAEALLACRSTRS